MSVNKEGNSGEIKLYRERPECLVVKILSTPDTDEMWEYEIEVLKVLEGRSRLGEKFVVAKNKEYGSQGLWHFFDLDSDYAKEWLARSGIELSEFL